jgi:hypothetical protein
MKIHLKRLICLLLCIATVFSLTSCEIVDYVSGWFEEEEESLYPRGYTGGCQTAYGELESILIIWFETYDEFIEAIERTRAQGTKIPRVAYFDCEEYGIDIKFCVILRRHLLPDIQEGESYFDKKLHDDDLSIFTCVFFEYISIEELEYTYFERYPGFRVKSEGIGTHYPAAVDYDSVEIILHPNINASDSYIPRYDVYYYGEMQFYFNTNSFGYDRYYISDENLEILENTIRFVE